MIIELPVGNTDPQPTEIPEGTIRANPKTFGPEMFYKGRWREMEPVPEEHLSEIQDWMRFGFTAEEAKNLIDFNKYLKLIPVSFLVQTNMGILRDGMDRRRP